MNLSTVDSSAFGFGSATDGAVHKLLARRANMIASEAVAAGLPRQWWCRDVFGVLVERRRAGRHPSVTAHCIRIAVLSLGWACEDLQKAAGAASGGDATDCEDVVSRAAAIVPARDRIVEQCERVLAPVDLNDVPAKRWALVGMISAFGALCDVAQVWL